jgi:hypothetical protein
MPVIPYFCQRGASENGSPIACQTALIVTQQAIPETIVKQLLKFIVKSTQLTFNRIKALSLQRSQYPFDPLADKGYTVKGTILRLHDTPFFSQIGTYPMLEGGGKNVLPFAQVDEQINRCDMVFPAFAALPAALRAYLCGAHPTTENVKVLLARLDNRCALIQMGLKRSGKRRIFFPHRGNSTIPFSPLCHISPEKKSPF